MVPLAVDSRIVAAVISGWTGIPVGRMLADEIRSVMTLKDRMAERIVGQPQALDAICRRIVDVARRTRRPVEAQGRVPPRRDAAADRVERLRLADDALAHPLMQREHAGDFVGEHASDRYAGPAGNDGGDHARVAGERHERSRLPCNVSSACVSPSRRRRRFELADCVTISRSRCHAIASARAPRASPSVAFDCSPSRL